ncbi:hypothetical protein [Bacillus massiliglaciei]|uniref:hypothetical protein n=1 Tax=Bacillus massiliglaciei TaxID=1816693 RepID=UPI000DA602C4|nr:hypothetical protein [Bacillus massiliglaciei]
MYMVHEGGETLILDIDAVIKERLGYRNCFSEDSAAPSTWFGTESHNIPQSRRGTKAEIPLI